MGSKKSDRPPFGNGASPGKIFIGGLAKDTTLETFVKYFERYGDITDSVIMKDRQTGRPRGFGFITYADPSVVDKIIEETHVINDKQVEIKRTIPKGSTDLKTKKIFVGGIPTTVTEDEFKGFFSRHGHVVEHEIIRDHVTKRSRGFGFIVFDSEQAVDKLLMNGNMIDMAGTKVEIKRAEPKKPSNAAPGPAFGSDPRAHSYDDDFSGLSNPYNNFGSGRFGLAPYRSLGGWGSRDGDYGRYGGGGGGYNGGYGDLDGSGYRGEPPFGYSSRFASYGRGYDGGYDGSDLGALGRGGRSGGYGNYGPGSGGYDVIPGSAYGGPGAFYGSRASYSGSSRYHPYGRMEDAATFAFAPDQFSTLKWVVSSST